ncbi:MAG TPA: SUF system NifU family Fe-S cluster assembly protein [Thermoanaerobaculia bacterium]
MSELRDLYQEVILDHNRHPRHFGPLPNANRSAKGHNPLCGDRVTVYLDVQGETIRGIAVEGSGCAISTASASLMTEALEGKSVADARALFRRFHALLTDPQPAPADDDLGKLEALTGVREFPMRVKCATLAWHALQTALDSPDDATISTEAS